MSPDPWIWPLVLLAGAVFFCGWLTSSLRALSLLNEPQLSERAEDGDTSALFITGLLQHEEQTKGRLVSAAVLTGLASGAIAVYGFLSPITQLITGCGISLGQIPLRILCVLLILLLTALLTLVCGWIVPCHMAARHPEKTLARRMAPLRLVLALFNPLFWLARKLANGLLLLLGLDPKERPDEVTEEEIRAMVDMGEETGAIETAEREMIENIFEFNNRSAQDVMTHRMDVSVIWMEDDRKAILDTISSTGLSRFPVCDKTIDDVVGILNTRDYLMELQQPSPRPLRALLREAYFVPGTVQADDLFRSMQRRKQHMAIVTDEYGGMSGIVTMEDLLQEIVGNIYDEFDPQDESEIVSLPDGRWRVSGSAPLQDIAEALDVQLPLDEEFDTLGGLVFSRLTMIPKDGETPAVETCGLHIQVERIAGHRVESAVISKQAYSDDHTEQPDKTEARNDHE